MVMVSKFSNFPDELNENDELREYELSESDCTSKFTKCWCTALALDYQRKKHNILYLI